MAPRATTIERVAVLETKFDDFSEKVLGELTQIRTAIEEVRLNGQTARTKNMAKRLGDPDDVEILASVVESRKRRAWLLGPLRGRQDTVINALLWGGSGLALAALNAWLHAHFPAFP